MCCQPTRRIHRARLADTQRLFLALWPDDRVRKSLGAVTDFAVKGNGRRTELANMHITLKFLGQLSGDASQTLQHILSDIQIPAFDLELDRFGYFARTGVVWLGPSSIPSALTQLVGEVEQAAAQIGIPVEKRAWRAHLTLARKARKIKYKQPSESINWAVSEFCLVQSVLGHGPAEYRIKRRWALVT